MKKAAITSDKPPRVVYEELVADANEDLLQVLPSRPKVLEKITKHRRWERERHRAAALERGEEVPKKNPVGKTISPRVTKKEKQQRLQHHSSSEPPTVPLPPPLPPTESSSSVAPPEPPQQEQRYTYGHN